MTNKNGSTNIANGATCDGQTVNIVGNNAAGIPDAKVAASLSNILNGWPCGAAVFSGTTVVRNEIDLANYTDPKTGKSYGDIAGLDRQINRTSLTMNKYFGNGYTLTSQSALTRQQSNVGADQSYNNTQFVPSFLGGSSWTSYNRDKLSYYSQELRLSSDTKGPMTWLAGAFLYHEDGEGLTGNGVIAKDAAGKVITAPLGLTPTSASSVQNQAFFCWRPTIPTTEMTPWSGLLRLRRFAVRSRSRSGRWHRFGYRYLFSRYMCCRSSVLHQRR